MADMEVEAPEPTGVEVRGTGVLRTEPASAAEHSAGSLGAPTYLNVTTEDLKALNDSDEEQSKSKTSPKLGVIVDDELAPPEGREHSLSKGDEDFGTGTLKSGFSVKSKFAEISGKVSTPVEKAVGESKDERLHVMREMVSTEKSYVATLLLLRYRFMEPLMLKNATIAKNPNIAAFFGNIDSLWTFHEKFVKDLEDRLNLWVSEVESPAKRRIGDLFLSYAGLFKIYSQYGRNYEVAMPMLSNPQDVEVAAFIGESEEALGMTLSSLTITPIQRIPRYELLLKQMFRNTPPEFDDYNDLSKAIDEIVKSAQFMNDAVRKREQMEQLMSIEKAFSRLKMKLAVPGRKLIKKGVITKVLSSSFHRDYMFHLFSDILLYSEESPLGLKLHRAIELSSIDLSKIRDPPKKHKNSFVLITLDKTLTLICKKEADLADWIEKIETSVNSIKGVGAAFSDLGLCSICSKAYSTENPRCVCSLCGLPVCDSCSQSQKLLKDINPVDPVRICDACIKSGVIDDEDRDFDAASAARRSRKTTMKMKLDRGSTFKAQVEELTRTERVYLDNLDILLTVYIRPILESGLTKKSEKSGKSSMRVKGAGVKDLLTGDLAIFFSNVEQVYTLNKEFVGLLVNRLENWTEKQSVSDIFEQYASLFKLYVQYARFSERVKKVLNTDVVKTHFKKAEVDPKAHGQDFNSLLQFPLDRIETYEHFLSEYAVRYAQDSGNEAEIEKNEAALKEIGQINDQIKTAFEEEKTLIRFEELEGLFIPKVDLRSVVRKLLKEGSLTKYSKRGKPSRYYFHLFSDMMIYSKPVKGTFQIKNQLSFKDINIQDVQDSKNIENAFVINTPSKTFLVSADSKYEKYQWLGILQESLHATLTEEKDLYYDEEEIKKSKSTKKLISSSSGESSDGVVSGVSKRTSLPETIGEDHEHDHDRDSLAPPTEKAGRPRLSSREELSEEENWRLKQLSASSRGKKTAPLFVFNKLVDKCQLCAASFNILVLRHHCRNCGNIFCASCSDQRWLMPKIHSDKPQRVCRVCFEELSTKLATGPAAPAPSSSPLSAPAPSSGETRERTRSAAGSLSRGKTLLRKLSSQ